MKEPRETAASLLRLPGTSVISGYRIGLFILFNDTDLCVE